MARPLCVLVSAVLLALALCSAPANAARDCGTIRFAGTKTTIHVLRGVTCRRAKAVARAFDRQGTGGPVRGQDGWGCALARQSDSYHGRPVGFSCGRPTRGDLRKAPHSLLGLL